MSATKTQKPKKDTRTPYKRAFRWNTRTMHEGPDSRRTSPPSSPDHELQ